MPRPYCLFATILTRPRYFKPSEYLLTSEDCRRSGLFCEASGTLNADVMRSFARVVAFQTRK